MSGNSLFNIFYVANAFSSSIKCFCCRRIDKILTTSELKEYNEQENTSPHLEQQIL